MNPYIPVTLVLTFLVDYLLILGTNRLCGYPPGWRRGLAAATIGAVYALMCMLPGFAFMTNLLWRTVSFALMAWVAFGFSISAFRKSVIFVLLSLAMLGIANGFGNGGVWSLLGSGMVVSLLCVIGFRDRPGSTAYVPVELNYAGKRVCLTALKDTGNGLRDPVTGSPVLVVGAEIAQSLTGLTCEQLRKPVEAVEKAIVPGLRLIPYRTVGQTGGLLLAMRLSGVRIGNWQGSSLVAFAPDPLEAEGAYQALTGGVA